MRLRRLHLMAFGPFSDRTLDFGPSAGGLAVVYGPNEAGKSSALRAMTDLRFGIPPQSTDNFIHAHRSMLLGGDFIDRNGVAHSLQRRKGRNATLSSVDSQAGPEIQALLDCGLSRTQYEAMFGLDHQRLRDGGAALLRGEGDIGAALFEVSAGVRSAPQVLAALDELSRRWFVPGARGAKGRINQAISEFGLKQREMKEASIRPQHWAELDRRHQQAAAELAALEARRREIEARSTLIVELRSVAPVLASLDAAKDMLESLQDAPLLSTDAAEVRAGAMSSLDAATRSARIAAESLAQAQQRLDALPAEDPILDFATAVRRLAANADDVDRYRGELAQAEVEQAGCREELDRIAARIDRSLDGASALLLAPSGPQAAEIEQRLHAVERARLALQEHQESAREPEAANEADPQPRPAPAAMAGLRRALDTIAASQNAIDRLNVLPAEIRTAERQAATLLSTLGLGDESRLRAIRPMLEAQIDEAIKAGSASETRATSLRERIEQLDGALADHRLSLSRLRASGTVATRQEVERARATRDARWRSLKQRWLGGTKPQPRPSHDEGEDTALALEFESGITQADVLVDALATDTERAAQVQGCEQQIDLLERDRAQLVTRLDEIVTLESNRLAQWNAALAGAGLQPMAPAALRDWQALLATARASFDAAHAKADEHADLQTQIATIAGQIREAIRQCGVALPESSGSDVLPASVELRALAAHAREIDQRLREQEARIQQASGEAQERQRQQARHQERAVALGARLDAALAALRPFLETLRLPTDSSSDAVRARMAEFSAVLNTHARLLEAKAGADRAARAVQLIETGVSTILAGLHATGESAAALRDPRLDIDRLDERLRNAEAHREARTRAFDALDRAREEIKAQEGFATLHREALSALCAAAGVDDPARLPQAEDRSQRKRRALDAIDAATLHLCQASRRPIEALREHLAERDAASLNEEASNAEAMLARLDTELRDARSAEERTRREIEALDGSDAAAAARDAMEQAAASVRSAMPHWIRTKLAHGLLGEALKQFRERAQGPMLKAASGYLSRMTEGEFSGLLQDEDDAGPVLVAQRADGTSLRVRQLSEGTLDQLYLALRLAALDIRRASGVDLPVVLDDILMTSDEKRSGAMLEALADFAHGQQVIVFTHHRHIAELAGQRVPGDRLTLLTL